VAVNALRAAGHDLAWAAEDCPSTADADVLAQAVRESRVLLTQDKDFGELAFRSGLPASCGVVLFRVAPFPALIASLALRVLSGASFEARCVVVGDGRPRERALPRASGKAD
jgi:hypothetical protein